jgi:glycosyltransferase involved in cell wall biosynthesis
MKVSIIIPVYNAEPYLEKCILSALNQTYRDIEIIAVNDGSTDHSADILAKYSDQVQIIHKKQGGVASARNAGIQIARGEWIKLLDNDDILYPNAIIDLIEAASQIDTKNKILYGHADYIDSDGKIIGQLIEPNYNALNSFEANTILLDHNIGIPSTWLIHKSVIDHCGLFDEETEHDDYEYHLRACLLFDCRFPLVEKKIIQYRFHSRQFTWQVMRKYKDQDEVAMKILNRLDPDQKNKYVAALNEFRASRSLFEKVAYFFRPVLKYLPIRLEIGMRVLYLKLRS